MLVLSQLASEPQEKVSKTIIASVVVKLNLMVFFDWLTNAIEFISVLAAKLGKSNQAKSPQQALIEEEPMTNYNHCQRCNKPLNFLSWLKFWERDKLCPNCEEEAL